MKNIPFSMLLLAASAALVALFAYAAFFLYGAIDGRMNESASLAARTSSAAQREEHLLSIAASLRETEEERKELDTYFVSDETVSDFFSFIEGTGTGAGVSVSIRNVKVVAGAKTREPERLQFELTASGAFAGLSHFIALIEAAPYDIRIDRLGLGGEDGAWEALIQASVAKNPKE